MFLRLLSVNSGPIEELVSEQMKHSRGFDEDNNIRERIFAFLIEIGDDTVTQEVGGWRPAMVELVLLFFSGVLHPTEPTPNSLVVRKGLLPLQLKAISSCFEDYLLTATEVRRIQLIARLQQLQTHMPTWPST